MSEEERAALFREQYAARSQARCERFCELRGNREAREALERATDRQRVSTWDDLVAGGVAGLLPPEAARAWAQRLLRPVDQGERPSLLRTFLAHNGNRSGTAEALGIHRNTLQQRLQEGSGLGADDVRAEQQPGVRVGYELDEAAGVLQRPAVGRVAVLLDGDDVIHAVAPCVLLGQTHAGHLGRVVGQADPQKVMGDLAEAVKAIREDTSREQLQTIIDRAVKEATRVR